VSCSMVPILSGTVSGPSRFFLCFPSGVSWAVLGGGIPLLLSVKNGLHSCGREIRRNLLLHLHVLGMVNRKNASKNKATIPVRC